MKVFHLQDPTNKTDFGIFRGRTVFHLLKKPVGKQYLKIPRILIPPEIFHHLKISAQFERALYVQKNIFLDPIHKKCLLVYGPATISDFPEKLAQNKYICVGSYNISSLLNISCPLEF